MYWYSMSTVQYKGDDFLAQALETDNVDSYRHVVDRVTQSALFWVIRTMRNVIAYALRL